MTSRVEWHGSFSLEIPPTWQFEDGSDVVTLYNPDGVGALTVSAARRLSPGEATFEVAKGIAAGFARQRQWAIPDHELKSCIIGEAPAVSFEYADSSGDHWHLWAIVDTSRVATITYVAAAADDADVERETREAIVSSLRWV